MDAAMIERIEADNQEFLALARSIPEAAAARADLVGAWSARQVLMHIIAWQEEALAVVTALRDGIYVSRHLNEDDFNATAVQQRQDHTWATLLSELAQSQAALVQLARSLPDALWADKRVPGWLEGSTLTHYDEHRPALQTAAQG